MKKNYLLGLIVLGLISLSVYSTYAMFTASVETNDIVSLSASTLPTNSEIVEYERLTIKSKEKKVIEYTVNNNTNNSLYYGVWYEMISPSSINDDIVIGKSEDTTSDTLGQLSSGNNAKVLFVIENKTNSNIVVNVGVGYGETRSLNLPTNRNLITEIYEESVLATEYITELYNNASKTTITNNSINYNYATSVGLMNDRLGGTISSLDGGNIRYYGADPNNYVSFNNELWRIIGVFKDIDDGTGKTGTRIKIARSESIGYYAWESNVVNEWSTATLNTYLNETYLNGLTSEAQGMIGNAKWNLGGWSTSQLYANQFYEYERGTTVSSGSSTEWTGKIALMYPSDYMYAGDLSKCSKDGYYWDTDQTNCRNTSWLRNTSTTQWTLSPNSRYSSDVFIVYEFGSVDDFDVSSSNASRPVLYLASTVEITGGEGTFGNPFTLS